jgi:hypothetical protein
MGTELEVEGKRRTSNWDIVITILHCCIVNVKRIHIHSTLAVVVVNVAVRLMLVLLRFFPGDATVPVTVLHLRELGSELARDRSTILVIAFTKVFLSIISSPDIM